MKRLTTTSMLSWGKKRHSLHSQEIKISFHPTGGKREVKEPDCGGKKSERFVRKRERGETSSWPKKK